MSGCILYLAVEPESIPMSQGLRDDRWDAPVLSSRSNHLCDKSSEYIVGPHSELSWDLREAEFSLQVT